MQLDDLLQPTSNDIILREAILTSKTTQDREYITELLPLIPAALWGAGILWTAYDAYQVKKALDKGEITKAEAGKMIGTDVAITLAAGGIGKLIGKGWKVGKKVYKTKKAAKAAEMEIAALAAAKVNAQVAAKVADVAPNAAAATATAIKNKVIDIMPHTSAAAVKIVKKIDNAYDKVDSKLDVSVPPAISHVDDLVTKVVPHSTAAVSPTIKTVKKVVNKVDQKKIDDLHHADNVANIKKTNKINDLHPTKATKITPAAVTTSKVTSKAVANKVDNIKKNIKKNADDAVSPAAAAAAKRALKKNLKKNEPKKKTKKTMWGLGDHGDKAYGSNLAGVIKKYGNF